MFNVLFSCKMRSSSFVCISFVNRFSLRDFNMTGIKMKNEMNHIT